MRPYCEQEDFWLAAGAAIDSSCPVLLLLAQVLHSALRAARDAVMEDGGRNQVPEVWAVLDKIKAFSGTLRYSAFTSVPVPAGGCEGRLLDACWLAA